MDITRDQESGHPIKIVMRRPDDWHHHFRVGEQLKLVTPMAARRFGRALAMPNLDPPITTCEQMVDYRRKIEGASGGKLEVASTLYLTPDLDPNEVERACQDKSFVGIKFMPFGVTTNSKYGIQNIADLWTPESKPHTCLHILSIYDKVLLCHGADGFAREDVTIGTRSYRAGDELDAYDQAKHFIKQNVLHIMEAHPSLKISLEHLSTIEEIKFAREHGPDGYLGVSVTAQHLLQDRRDTHRGGLRPHTFWWPAMQPFEHRQELRRFVCEGHPFAYLGSDSAPQPRDKKESACCPGGVLMAHGGIEFYAEAFEDMGALDQRFEDFASKNGANSYGYPLNKGTITLVREEWTVQNPFLVEEGGYDKPIVPFRLGEKVRWKIV
jgi:dihydroorotase